MLAPNIDLRNRDKIAVEVWAQGQEPEDDRVQVGCGPVAKAAKSGLSCSL